MPEKMIVAIYGTGCSKCDALAELASSVASERGLNFEIVRIKSIEDIRDAGVYMTPALAVDDVVYVTGRVPDRETVGEIFDRAIAEKF